MSYRKGKRRSKAANRGFTLVELLTALAVISIAGYISISLLTRTQDISLANRHRILAGDLAIEQLAIIETTPDVLNWAAAEDLRDSEPGTIVEIPSMQSANRQRFNLPSTHPTSDAQFVRMRDLYEKFQWAAYVTVPEEGAVSMDLTVAVRWTLQGRDESRTMTTAVPISFLEGQS